LREIPDGKVVSNEAKIKPVFIYIQQVLFFSNYSLDFEPVDTTLSTAP